MSLIAWSCAYNIKMPPPGCGFVERNGFLYTCYHLNISVQPFIESYPRHVTLLIKALSSLSVHCPFNYFTQFIKENMAFCRHHS